MVAIKGHFDGKVFVPDEAVGAELPRHQPLILHVEVATLTEPSPTGASKAPQSAGLWDVLEKYAGSVEAPEDWAAQHDHYLYGTPKRTEGAGG